jgi:anti-sigma B factor antagonist
MLGVACLTSACLFSMPTTNRMCRRYNRGEVVLAAVPQNIKETLELAGFTDIFKIYDDVVSAVGSF